MAETQKESEIIEDADFNAVKKIYDVKDLVGEAATISHSDKAWQKVHSRIRRKRLYNNIVYWKYAAIIMVIFITAGLFLGKTLSNYFSEPEQFISIVTPNGKIKNLKLPDGTEVWINSGSLLKYSNPFDRANRHIILEGEAYFEVCKDKSKPFIVNIKGLQIEVLGTSFNIKAYPDDKQSFTTLVEGKVKPVGNRLWSA